MSTEVLRRGLADRRRALAAWIIGIVAYIGLIAAVFPSIEGSAQFDKLINHYPDVLKAMFGLSASARFTTGPGYIDAELFSLMLPLLVLVLAIGTGAGTLAGEEEQGLLELVLAAPIRRRSVVLAKAAALAIEVAAAAAAVFLALAVASPLADLHLNGANLAGACVGLWLLSIFHGWLAIAVGAATRHRASAIGVPAAFAAVGYLVATLHTLAGWLDPFRYLSGFYYAGRQTVSDGPDWPRLVVLLAAGAVALIVAALIFERRDVASA